jgi:hypothetical protein
MKQVKKVFSDLGGMGISLAGIGVSTAVGAAAAKQSGVSGLTEGFNTLGSMSSVAVTAGAGKSILSMSNKYVKNKRAVRVHSGKHTGYGEW